jgi:hypothetical protein
MILTMPGRYARRLGITRRLVRIAYAGVELYDEERLDRDLFAST